ncbi:hypothetical protein ACFWZ2_04860 [Streptomyces sp. NPDC059002]|uniref:hypothetical protein n=1 Tax=Streptomyces sp. NPDC059002 TaxID=3346690 RepID=UPI00368E30D8
MSESFDSVLTLAAVSPYGTLDLGQARRWGYGFDPDRAMTWNETGEPEGRAVRPREYEVLQSFGAVDGAATVVNGRKVPKGGCTAQASRRLAGDLAKRTSTWAYVPERSQKIDKAVAEDRRVRRVFGDWSRCVEDKGFKRYDSPTAAFRDKAWRKGAEDGNTNHTKRELGTAVADVECNRKLNVAGVWWAVSNEKQRADLRREPSRYEAVRADQDRLRDAIRKALGES